MEGIVSLLHNLSTFQNYEDGSVWLPQKMHWNLIFVMASSGELCVSSQSFHVIQVHRLCFMIFERASSPVPLKCFSVLAFLMHLMLSVVTVLNIFLFYNT